MQQKTTIPKLVLTAIILLAYLFAPLINTTSVQVVHADAPTLAQNVQATPITADGISYNFISEFADVAMNDDHYFVLADDMLLVFDQSGTLLMNSAPSLSNAQSLAIYEDLVFVVCDYQGVNSLVVFLVDSQLTLVKSISVSDLGGNKLTDMVLVVNAPSAHLYIINQNGADFSFINFEMSFTDLMSATTMQFTAGSRQCYISLKLPLSTQNSGITALAYGKTQSSASSGLIFVGNSSVYYQAVTSSFSVKLFDESDISDITFDNNLNNIVYTKKNLKLRSIHDIDTVREFTDDLPLVSAQSCYYYKERVFISETTDCSARVYTTLSNEHSGYIVLAKSSKVGYFNSPVSVFVQNSKIYATDMLNSRVQVFDGQVSVLNSSSSDLLRPTHIAVDRTGQIFVADSAKNSIVKYTQDGVKAGEFFNTAQHFNIVDMTLDANDNIYAINSTDNAIYKKGVDSDSFTVLESGFLAPQRLEYSKRKDFMLVLSSNKLYKYQNQTILPINHSFSSTIVDFALDDFDNVYALNDNNLIEKYALDDLTLTLTSQITSYSTSVNMSPVNAQAITICQSSNQLVNRGDIIIVDSVAHTIRKIERSILGVQLFEDESTSVDYASKEPHTAPVTIHPILRQSFLFAQPNGATQVATISKNTNVIVLEYDLSQSDFYSFVVFTDKTRGQTLTGFVLKNSLGTALPHSQPRFVNGRVLHNQTTVYKYPASFSTKLQRDGGDYLLNQGDFVKLVSFVADYKDPTGVPWVCLELENGYGYVSAENVIYKNYTLTTTRPLPNATIKTEAKVYDLDLVPLEEKPLAQGTRVTVVGSFDPRSEYTRINYYNAEFGILDCYVETSALEYNNTTTAEIIALILFIIVVILLMVTIIYCIRKKQQNI